MTAHARPTFVPSPRATNWLLAVGFVALGAAIYIRYLVIEQASVGIACDGGLATTTCLVRRIATQLFNQQVFGIAALGFAALTLLRPSVALFSIALALAATGIVLYNTALSALAAALLVMSFARPAATPD